MVCIYEGSVDMNFICPVRHDQEMKTHFFRDPAGISLTGISPGMEIQERNFRCHAFCSSGVEQQCNYGSYCPAFRTIQKVIQAIPESTDYIDFVRAVESIPLSKYLREREVMKKEWWQSTQETIREASRTLRSAVRYIMSQPSIVHIAPRK